MPAAAGYSSPPPISTPGAACCGTWVPSPPAATTRRSSCSATSCWRPAAFPDFSRRSAIEVEFERQAFRGDAQRRHPDGAVLRNPGIDVCGGRPIASAACPALRHREFQARSGIPDAEPHHPGRARPLDRGRTDRGAAGGGHADPSRGAAASSGTSCRSASRRRRRSSAPCLALEYLDAGVAAGRRDRLEATSNTPWPSTSAM